MNILIAVTNMTAGNGGVTTHIIDLCRELAKRSYKVVLVSDEKDCDYQSSIEKLKEFKNFKFISVDMHGIQSNPKQLFKATKNISSIVRKEKINIMHMHSQSLCVVGALVKILTGIPYIWTNHIDEMANPNLFKKILHVLHFPIISVSTDLKLMLVNEFGVNEKRITVVYNGINPEKFPSLSSEERSDLIDKYQCNGKYVVSLLARMSYGKGHIYLLEAVNKVQTEANIQDIKVLIAGKLHNNECNYLKQLEQYADQHHIDMQFLGFQNPRDVFGVSDIAVLPSLYEGFPLTVLESLIMECPVIRSDTTGWIDTQDITMVFPKKDVDAFSKHLLYAYNYKDEIRKMGAAGRLTVLDKFTINRQVDETVEVYERYAKSNN